MDATLSFVTTGMEVAVAALLLRRRVYKLLPLFCTYIVWTIVSDAGMFLANHRFPSLYFTIYLIELSLDSVLQFGVLVEVAWSALRPYRSVLPRGALLIIAALVLGIGAAVWPLAHVTALPDLTPSWHFMVRVQQTFSILRIIFFLILAGFSQLLAIGWRDRELQVATGFGFYALVGLGGSLIHAQQASAAHYHMVDVISATGYLISLVYWAFSFAQQEAVRQEINPKMQVFLTQMAGAARAQRVALDDPNSRNFRNNGRR